MNSSYVFYPTTFSDVKPASSAGKQPQAIKEDSSSNNFAWGGSTSTNVSADNCNTSKSKDGPNPNWIQDMKKDVLAGKVNKPTTTASAKAPEVSFLKILARKNNKNYKIKSKEDR